MRESGVPFIDSPGGLAVILCNPKQDAAAVVETDPAVKAGLFSAELHPWMPVE